MRQRVADKIRFETLDRGAYLAPHLQKFGLMPLNEPSEEARRRIEEHQRSRNPSFLHAAASSIPLRVPDRKLEPDRRVRLLAEMKLLHPLLIDLSLGRVDLSLLFDQSVFVKAAISSVIASATGWWRLAASAAPAMPARPAARAAG